VGQCGYLVSGLLGRRAGHGALDRPVVAEVRAERAVPAENGGQAGHDGVLVLDDALRRPGGVVST
jgi:hypothetical protein